MILPAYGVGLRLGRHMSDELLLTLNAVNGAQRERFLL